MWALKGLVIGMGVLIFAGLIVVVVTIANRMGGDGAAKTPMATESTLQIPAGAQVLETTLDGSRVALRLRLRDGATAIHVFNLADGKSVGVHRIEAGGQTP